MDTCESTTVHMKRCLRRLSDDDVAARAELLGFAHRRLKQLASRMFCRFPRLHAYEHEDDLFQEAMIRLWQSLDGVEPTTVTAFMELAALQMRRSLCDLARKHHGRASKLKSDELESPISKPASEIAANHQIEDATNAPEMLMVWEEFHRAAGELNEPERTAFDLLFYGELPQGQVADLMGISERQVRRHWQSARRTVGRKMGAFWPGL